MELIVVVIIIGVLAAIAIPSYRIQTLKMKNQEAVRILMAVWEAQMNFNREQPLDVYTSTLTDLDIDIPPSKNFSVWVGIPDPGTFAVFSCSGDVPRSVGSLLPITGGGYALLVLEDGRVVCEPCDFPLCKKMGFPDW